MKTISKILLGGIVGVLFLISCNDKKGKSSSILGDIFEDKISVSMQSNILAVYKGKNISIYEFPNQIETTEEAKKLLEKKFSEEIEEIEFLPFSYELFVRSKDSLKLYEYNLSQNNLDLIESFRIPYESIDDMAIGDKKILVRDGLNLKEFQEEKGVFNLVKAVDLKKENQIENVNEMSRIGEYIVVRDKNTLQTVRGEEKIKLTLPKDNIDEIFFNDWGIMGIRTGNDIKFYEAKKDTLVYLPQFDFEIK